MEKEMKKWQKPELIVLVRNKPEEAVLNGCKSEPEEGPRPEGVTRGDCDASLEPGDNIDCELVVST